MIWEDYKIGTAMCGIQGCCHLALVGWKKFERVLFWLDELVSSAGSRRRAKPVMKLYCDSCRQRSSLRWYILLIYLHMDESQFSSVG